MSSIGIVHRTFRLIFNSINIPIMLHHRLLYQTFYSLLTPTTQNSNHNIHMRMAANLIISDTECNMDPRDELYFSHLERFFKTWCLFEPTSTGIEQLARFIVWCAYDHTHAHIVTYTTTITNDIEFSSIYT